MVCISTLHSAVLIDCRIRVAQLFGLLPCLHHHVIVSSDPDAVPIVVCTIFPCTLVATTSAGIMASNAAVCKSVVHRDFPSIVLRACSASSVEARGVLAVVLTVGIRTSEHELAALGCLCTGVAVLALEGDLLVG